MAVADVVAGCAVVVADSMVVAGSGWTVDACVPLSSSWLELRGAEV